jgi:hypothetical protein
MPNFLEQLVAEWYEIRGYFVRRNIKVGKRLAGGYDCELDIVAVNPDTRHLVHLEPSMDAHSWQKREDRFKVKFEAGKKYIPEIFSGFGDLPIDQIAVFAIGSSRTHAKIGGGRVVHVGELMNDIMPYVSQRKIQSAAIPEQFVILRTLQFAANLWVT